MFFLIPGKVNISTRSFKRINVMQEIAYHEIRINDSFNCLYDLVSAGFFIGQ